MDTYSLLREIADSWVLLAMFAFFIGAAILAFLPSQNSARVDASMIPLRNDIDVTARADTDEKSASAAADTQTKGASHV